MCKRLLSLAMFILFPVLLTFGQQVYLHTSQDVYAPGSTIHYKAYLNHEGDPSGGTPIQLIIVSVDGGIVQQHQQHVTGSSQSGSFDLSIAIPDGFYDLLALPEGERVENAFHKKIRVRPIEIPGVIIDLSDPQQAYEGGQDVSIATRFSGPDGVGMKRMKYSWKLLVAGQVVEQGDGKADKSGMDMIGFSYPRTESNSLISLEVMVDYFGHTYEAAIILPSVDMPALISIMPEGGLLIDGYETQVGLNTQTLYGEPLAITGRIVDESGQEVLTVSTDDSGYGLFNLTPDAGKPLRLIVDQPESVRHSMDLPPIRSNGLVLRYEGLEKDQFQFSASNPVKDTYMSVTVKAYQFGLEKYAKRLLIQTDKYFSVMKDLFEPGLIQVLVYNDRDELMAGRIIDLPNTDQTPLPIYDSGSLSVVDAVFCPGLNQEISIQDYFKSLPGLPIFKSEEDKAAYLLYALSEFQLADKSKELPEQIEHLFKESNTEQYIARIEKLRSDNQRLLEADLGFFEYFIQNKAQFDLYNMLPQKLSPEERIQRMLDQGKPVLSVIRSIRAYRLVNNQLVFRGGADSFTDTGGAVIVIDGVPKGADVGVIENMSPHDVASIKISTSISDIMRYSGMEDTAGVVIIETRKGDDTENDSDSTSHEQFDPLLLWNPELNSDADPEIPNRTVKGPIRVTRVNPAINR